MARMTKEQPNTMDEPGGPEAPLPAGEKTDSTGNVRKDKAAHGEPTDADFEPPIVPGDTKSAPDR
ncbi:conserved hypothetical protein [Paraburkholderia sabiae]|jgi:hypothetical protein|uniref:hypothetical protein n=1 Tax=Paraburkholderia sabiae TaxID=273251 RepID=UPI001CAF6E4D|nr:hypothetical protein [Paraburkholderia sabiae]CAG9189896.1 conserved hypothetical protein [Paraburkholderia sabiae]